MSGFFRLNEGLVAVAVSGMVLNRRRVFQKEQVKRLGKYTKYGISVGKEKAGLDYRAENCGH